LLFFAHISIFQPKLSPHFYDNRNEISRQIFALAPKKLNPKIKNIGPAGRTKNGLASVSVDRQFSRARRAHTSRAQSAIRNKTTGFIPVLSGMLRACRIPALEF